MSNPANVIVCNNVGDDEYHSLALLKSIEVMNFLSSLCENGVKAEDDILYGEAVFAWELGHKDPFWFYATKDAVMLARRNQLQERFGLQILTLAESEQRQKFCSFGNKMCFGDLFRPIEIFKA